MNQVVDFIIETGKTNLMNKAALAQLPKGSKQVLGMNSGREHADYGCSCILVPETSRLGVESGGAVVY